MARPARSLEQHVLQASFRGRRHHQLLAREPLPPEWRLFAALQARYQAASSEPERRAVALQFEQAVTAAHNQAKARDGGLAGPGLEEQLSALGKPGSLPHLLAFFPALLRYPGGPYKLNETPWAIRRPAPKTGQDNRTVYLEELGLRAEDLVRLQEAGTICDDMCSVCLNPLYKVMKANRDRRSRQIRGRNAVSRAKPAELDPVRK